MMILDMSVCVTLLWSHQKYYLCALSLMYLISYRSWSQLSKYPTNNITLDQRWHLLSLQRTLALFSLHELHLEIQLLTLSSANYSFYSNLQNALFYLS